MKSFPPQIWVFSKEILFTILHSTWQITTEMAKLMLTLSKMDYFMGGVTFVTSTTAFSVIRCDVPTLQPSYLFVWRTSRSAPPSGEIYIQLGQFKFWTFGRRTRESDLTIFVNGVVGICKIDRPSVLERLMVPRWAAHTFVHVHAWTSSTD